LNRLLLAVLILVAFVAGCDNRSIMGCTGMSNSCETASTGASPVGDTPETIRKKAEKLLEAAGFVQEGPTGRYPAVWNKGKDAVVVTEELAGSVIKVTLPEGSVQCDLEPPIAVPDAAGQIGEIKRKGYNATLQQNDWNCKKLA
jgi:hypothetical protein